MKQTFVDLVKWTNLDKYIILFLQSFHKKNVTDVKSSLLNGDSDGCQSFDGPNGIVLLRKVLLQEVLDESGKPVEKNFNAGRTIKEQMIFNSLGPDLLNKFKRKF